MSSSEIKLEHLSTIRRYFLTNGVCRIRVYYRYHSSDAVRILVNDSCLTYDNKVLWAMLGGGLWPSRIMSIELPSEEVFEIRGSHLLRVTHSKLKIKLANKKTRMEEARNNILIPPDLKVVDLVKAFRVIGSVSGIFEIPSSSNKIKITDNRTAADLGWRHGTELRLEYVLNILEVNNVS